MAAATENPSRIRPLTDLPTLAERAADLLRTPQTLLPLNVLESAHVVVHMGLITFPAGAVVLREGDGQRADFMLLLLEGEIQVETRALAGREPLTISVIGPGSIIGEMSLVDGAPRSATCTALGPVVAAGLSRKGLERLIDEQPRAAAKLMMGLAQRIADRLRALGEHLQMYADLTPAPRRDA